MQLYVLWINFFLSVLLNLQIRCDIIFFKFVVVTHMNHLALIVISLCVFCYFTKSIYVTVLLVIILVIIMVSY